jgi:hypothetical protein
MMIGAVEGGATTSGLFIACPVLSTLSGGVLPKSEQNAAG